MILWVLLESQVAYAWPPALTVWKESHQYLSADIWDGFYHHECLVSMCLTRKTLSNKTYCRPMWKPSFNQLASTLGPRGDFQVGASLIGFRGEFGSTVRSSGNGPAGWWAEIIEWRSPDSLQRVVCNFGILIPGCNQASHGLENSRGIETRSITPRWTVRMVYVWLSPSRPPVGRRVGGRRRKAWKGLWRPCDKLVHGDSWRVCDHTRVA